MSQEPELDGFEISSQFIEILWQWFQTRPILALGSFAMYLRFKKWKPVSRTWPISDPRFVDVVEEFIDIWW